MFTEDARSVVAETGMQIVKVSGCRCIGSKFENFAFLLCAAGYKDVTARKKANDAAVRVRAVRLLRDCSDLLDLLSTDIDLLPVA
jgi:hypothetical protein